ncbi:MAG: hypothetical protein IPP97_21130 [Candidatus Obscuribacter sp.]|nr:hypothetical protein [Candidatus Obscuribacter sp.]
MQENDNKKNQLKTTNGRLFYEVEAGDSLASISLKHYGDARFARLIFTINRGEIPIRCDGFNTFAYIFPGQRVLLPNKSEADVYRRNFLTESSRSKFDLAHYARPAMPSDSIPAELMPGRPSSYGWGEPKADDSNSFSNNTKYSITPAIPNAPAIPQFQLVSVRESAPKEVAINQSRIMAAFEECLGHETINMQPTDIQPRIEITQTNKPVIEEIITQRIEEDENLFGKQGTLEIVTLSHYCRVMKFDSFANLDELVIKLQIFDNQKWLTISSYAITRDITSRSSHGPDGSVDRVNIELPTTVAKELSLNDFTKNWKNYTKIYFNQKEKIKLQQVATLHAYKTAV